MKDLSIQLEDYEGLGEQKPLDSTEAKKGFLLVSKSGNHIRVSRSAWQLLQAVRLGMSPAEISEAMRGENTGEAITPELIERKYQDVAAKLAAIEERSMRTRLPWGFWWKFRLIPAAVVRQVVRPLALLYHPAIASLFLLIIAAALVFGVGGGIPRTLDEGAWITAYLLFTASLIVHEFGHAAAAARYGAPPHDIGFAMYLIYPAFYSDVTAAWRLTRLQRVAVDLGGCYFQFIAGTGMLVAFQAWHWEPLRLTFLLILYSSLFSLNPIFKFDGYWALADLLGVTNLSAQPRRIRRHLLDRFRHKPAAALPWPGWITAVLICYSIVSSAVWTYFIARLFPLLFMQAKTFILDLARLSHSIGSGLRPSLHDIQGLLASCFFLLLTSVMLWQLCKRGYSILRSIQVNRMASSLRPQGAEA